MHVDFGCQTAVCLYIFLVFVDFEHDLDRSSNMGKKFVGIFLWLVGCKMVLAQDERDGSGRHRR